MSELEDEARNTDWEKFTKYGYRILQPTYPISILGDESADVVLIATSNHKDGELPINKEVECIIEVYFGKSKMNKIKFPFLLKDDDIPDDRIEWYSPFPDN